MLQASSSENDDELETNSVTVNETFPLTYNFTVLNVSAHTEYTVRAVATYAQATLANMACNTTQYEGQPLSLTTSCKHWFTYQHKCLFCMQKYKKTFSKNVEGCRDGHAKNHRN